jgi:hypothetical protein
MNSLEPQTSARHPSASPGWSFLPVAALHAQSPDFSLYCICTSTIFFCDNASYTLQIKVSMIALVSYARTK